MRPHSERIAARFPMPYIGEFLLLIFALLTLGVFEPQFHVVEFDRLTLRGAVEEGSANPFNQLRWLTLASFASVAALVDQRRVLRLAQASLPLLLLVGYCLLSVAWSSHHEIALRRCFGIIVPMCILLVAIALIERPRNAALCLYIAFWIALLLNAAVASLASSFDEFGHFRGATSNKNVLGSIAALATLSGVALIPWLKRGWSRALCAVYIIAWMAILAATLSKTSLVLAAIVPLGFFMLRIVSGLLGVSLFLASTLLALLAAVVMLLLYAAGGNGPADLVQLVWPDATFTGRTALWSFMAHQLKDTWLTGAGFGSIWGIGFQSPNLFSAYDFVRLANQAHNGYLDVLAALGVIGLVLLGTMLLHFDAVADRFRSHSMRIYRLSWFIVLFSLIHNLMESSLLVPFAPVWHLTLLAVLMVMRFADQDV
jgi:exopolysaccharide production protein ExoQ